MSPIECRLFRLEKIRSTIKDGEKLCAAIILCSKTRRRVVYSNAYGKVTGRLPVLECGRTVASTIKIALYSAFLEKNTDAISAKFEDHPVTVKWGDKLFVPRNADNKFRGAVTLEYAFANSINTIALQVIQKLGVETFVKYLRKIGISQPLPNTPLLALGPVKLTGWELLATLSPIVYDGHLVYLEGQGKQFYTPTNNGERLISTLTPIP